MKNVKAIELTKSAFGLEPGTVLSRLSANEPFTYVNETVGDSYSSFNSVSVSESLITNELAKSVDWFERKRSAKHVIQEQSERIDELNKYIESTEKAYSEIVGNYHKLTNRINTKLAEFEEKLRELELSMEEDIIAGETLGWADEAMTVYYNLIDLLKKLSA